MISNLFRGFITSGKNTPCMPAWRGVEPFARKRSLNLEHLFRFLQPFFLTPPLEPESFLSLHDRRHRLCFPGHFPWRLEPRRSADQSRRAVLSLTRRALMGRGGRAVRYKL